MAKLVLRFGQSVLKEYSLQTEPITIGRSPQSSICIDNPAVSFSHTKIYFKDGNYVVEDLNSLNGTFVNGKRVTQAVLRGGDLVEVGSHSIQFLIPPPGKEAPGAAPAPAPAPSGPAVEKIEGTMVLDTRRARELHEKGAPKAAGAADQKAKRMGKLVVVKGRTTEQEYLLTTQTSIVGKSKSATVRLKGWFTPQICAFITKQGDSYFLTRGQEKKLFVNGQALAGRHELRDGDVLAVGKAEFRFSVVAW